MQQIEKQADISLKIHAVLDKVAETLCQYLEKTLPSISPNWWQDMVLPSLMRDVERRRISTLSELDLSALLRVFDANWRVISAYHKLPLEVRSYSHELRTVRNRWAHRAPGTRVNIEDLSRDLDTARRLVSAIGASEELLDPIRRLQQAFTGVQRAGSLGTAGEPIPTEEPLPKLRKSEAIKLMLGHGSTENLRNHNVTFANVNVAKHVWWMEIATDVLAAGGTKTFHYILVFNNRTSELHLLVVPIAYFRENQSKFKDRSDKKRIGLELAVDDRQRFRNVSPVDSGVEFSQFLVETFRIPAPRP